LVFFFFFFFFFLGKSDFKEDKDRLRIKHSYVHKLLIGLLIKLPSHLSHQSPQPLRNRTKENLYCLDPSQRNNSHTTHQQTSIILKERVCLICMLRSNELSHETPRNAQKKRSLTIIALPNPLHTETRTNPISPTSIYNYCTLLR